MMLIAVAMIAIIITIIAVINEKCLHYTPRSRLTHTIIFVSFYDHCHRDQLNIIFPHKFFIFLSHPNPHGILSNLLPEYSRIPASWERRNAQGRKISQDFSRPCLLLISRSTARPINLLIPRRTLGVWDPPSDLIKGQVLSAFSSSLWDVLLSFVLSFSLIEICGLSLFLLFPLRYTQTHAYTHAN